ncbi:MAG: hypothetical protein IMX01_09025 [Limnochordaceae bacterium]|nr:hypothetical protein [Limnochordaceae bacterium]
MLAWQWAERPAIPRLALAWVGEHRVQAGVVVQAGRGPDVALGGDTVQLLVAQAYGLGGWGLGQDPAP